MNKLTNKLLAVFVLAILATGCYHTQITTGETPSTEVYEIEWASSWIGGLVPPEVVNAEEECTNGVAIVETELSFLNMLVGVLTFSIYTPMHIIVTCATGGSAMSDSTSAEDLLSVESGATDEEVRRVFRNAAERSMVTGHPVYVALK